LWRNSYSIGQNESSCADASQALSTYGASFDIIFCDPPFGAQGIYESLETLAPNALQPRGFLYVESAREYETFGGLSRVKHMRASAAHAQLFRNE
jgi:16S rRNA G966 N2-methylase RsmD